MNVIGSLNYKKILKMTAVVKQHSKHINKIGNNKKCLSLNVSS